MLAGRLGCIVRKVSHASCLSWQSRGSFLVVEKKYLFWVGRMFMCSCRYGNAASISKTIVKFVFVFIYFIECFLSTSASKPCTCRGVRRIYKRHSFSESWVYNVTALQPVYNLKSNRQLRLGICWSEFRYPGSVPRVIMDILSLTLHSTVSLNVLFYSHFVWHYVA